MGAHLIAITIGRSLSEKKRGSFFAISGSNLIPNFLNKQASYA